MKKVFFIPGPSQLYPSVEKHFLKGFKEQISSISHRSKQFQEIYQDLSTGLKDLLNIPSDYHVFVVGSGTEAMERTIQNCVARYSYHFINGDFSKRFFRTAQEIGKKPTKLEVPLGQGFDFKGIDISKKTELICITHNETSSGVMIPSQKIHMVAKQYPDILIAVDTVSSSPYGDLDYRLLDIVFFSVHKLFGLPAGLGILIVSPRAIKISEQLLSKGKIPGSYHGFSSLLQYEQKYQTPETPPVLEMYVLGRIVQDMQLAGLKNINKAIDRKAKLLYEFLDTSHTLRAFVEESTFRSPTTIVINIEKTKKDVKKMLSEKGFIVSGGYGQNKDIQIRIANYPAHSEKDVRGLIKLLESI
jgi:phosphoserine aminotransferase